MLLIKKQLIVVGALVTLPLLAYQPEKKADNQWSKLKKPTKGQIESIGSYANGCLSGAEQLMPSGAGYIDMRRNRNRYYGHPKLIQFIRELGLQTLQKHRQKHLIGDLSQPRGGRMNFGHSSHQVGLDVDIWMQTLPASQTVNPYRDMSSIVDKPLGIIRQETLTKPIRDALYFSANHPDVARVFVNPVVKAQLCQTEKSTQWLRKLRPWWGHDKHFHVRLYCPENSLECKNQKPPPEGDGCNESLYNWVTEQRIRTGYTGKLALPILPAKAKKKSKVAVKKRPPEPPESCNLIRRSKD